MKIIINAILDLLDSKGDTIWQPQFESVYLYTRIYYKVKDSIAKYWIVERGQKFGLIDVHGTIIIEPQYEEFDIIEWTPKELFIMVKKVNQWGFINQTGTPLLPIEHFSFTFDYGKFITVHESQEGGECSIVTMN
ncbi:MAG: WG repeat-containing protein [Crocinitomicaceae bacterium]|nr:WG repeat-containing protein [Crocinitomicaceae bacterium]